MENGRSWSGRIPLGFEDAASSTSVNPRSASNAGIGTSYHSCAHTACRCQPSELPRRWADSCTSDRGLRFHPVLLRPVHGAPLRAPRPGCRNCCRVAGSLERAPCTLRGIDIAVVLLRCPRSGQTERRTRHRRLVGVPARAQSSPRLVVHGLLGARSHSGLHRPWHAFEVPDDEAGRPTAWPRSWYYRRSLADTTEPATRAFARGSASRRNRHRGGPWQLVRLPPPGWSAFAVPGVCVGWNARLQPDAGALIKCASPTAFAILVTPTSHQRACVRPRPVS